MGHHLRAGLELDDLRRGARDGHGLARVLPEAHEHAEESVGEGRVVAFSGQDFLSSGVRSTLLGEVGVRALIANAVDWVSPGIDRANVRILAANGLVGDVLLEAGVQSVGVAEVRFVQGLEAIRNWGAEALAEVDVAIVQVNEWGTSHVTEADVVHIRRFVEAGGGLLIAGSALHWSWWLNWTSEQNQGDAILEDTGISWPTVSVRDVAQGRIHDDPLGSPAALWCGYIDGAELTPTQLGRLTPLFWAAARDGRTRELDMAVRRVVSESPPTLVFDEVDAGVGGTAAHAVAAALAGLAGDRQVLVVTHLAQVAACADQQLAVEKVDDGVSARATIRRLGHEERIVEVSRMLSGSPDSATARDHAAELLGGLPSTAS